MIGWIFIAFAAGIVLISLFEGPDDRREMLQASIVPLIVGLVVLGYVAWAKRDWANGVGTRAEPPRQTRARGK